MITDLPDLLENNEKIKEKGFEGKLNKLSMEYNYLIGTQLEEQRNFFEEKA